MISGGGTGGHVYPALAVVETFRRDPNEINCSYLVWVGHRNGLEQRLVEQAQIEFQGISAAGLRGKNPVSWLSGFMQLGQGYLQSRQLIAHYRPDVLFVTGGYVCVPTTLAAYHQGVPILIYLPDIEPGQAIRFLSRYASKVAVTNETAQSFFPPGLTTVTGYPVRDTLYQLDKNMAQTTFHLDPTLPTLLVTGGSQGARSINKAIANQNALNTLLLQVQIIHSCGQLDIIWAEKIRMLLPELLKSRYHLYAYIDQMPSAMAAADLVVCRAGASSLGELPAAGVASILVPYPHSGAHQWANATYMVEQGVAWIIADHELDDKLTETIINLLHIPKTRLKMSQTAKSLARPSAAIQIAHQLKALSER